MSLHLRIRKVRELKNWKQTAVASSMNVTQQAYSCLEQGSNKVQIKTLNRFCEAMGVSLDYLISDIEITDETLRNYGTVSFASLAAQVDNCNKKIDVYEELLTKVK